MTHGERTERKTSLLCDLFHIEMVVVVCVCVGGGVRAPIPPSVDLRGCGPRRNFQSPKMDLWTDPEMLLGASSSQGTLKPP